MELAALAALRTPEGSSALAAAAEVAGGDPLTAANALRARGIAPDLAAAALTQAELRARAVGKFGPDADRMWFTRTGLEQATRRVVDPGSNIEKVVDLGFVGEPDGWLPPASGTSPTWDAASDRTPSRSRAPGYT